MESAWIATQAYCDIGLFCAARAHLILALNRSLRSVLEDAEISFDALTLTMRLAWVELASGRLALLLDAVRTADRIAGALDLSSAARDAFLNERSHIEAMLVRAIAISRIDDVEAIRIAPAVFEEHQLHLAAQAARVLLGHPDDEFLAITGGISLADIQAQPLPEEVGAIDWQNGNEVTLRTRILGCDFTAVGIRTKEQRSLVLSLFAALEGFVATGFADQFAPMIDRVELQMDDSSTDAKLNIGVEEDECGEPLVRVRFARGTLATYAGTSSFISRASAGVGTIVANVCLPNSADHLKRMFEIDAVQDRAFGLLHACAMDDTTEAPPALGNLLSGTDSPTIDVVDHGRFRVVETSNSTRPWEGGRVSLDEPPAQLEFSHRRTRLASVINMRQWDRAGWTGVAVALYPQSSTPYLHLIFRNMEAAAKILRGLRRRIGAGESDSFLRVAVLTGVDKNHPTHYRVGIAPASAASFDEGTKTVIFASRLLTMTPDTSTNLDILREAFDASGRFRLSAVKLPADQRMQPEPIDVEPIELRRLDVKAAWQVSEEDPLFMMLLQPEDDPFVPSGVDRPEELPVYKLLHARRKRRRER